MEVKWKWQGQPLRGRTAGAQVPTHKANNRAGRCGLGRWGMDEAGKCGGAYRFRSVSVGRRCPGAATRAEAGGCARGRA